MLHLQFDSGLVESVSIEWLTVKQTNNVGSPGFTVPLLGRAGR